MSKRIWKWGRPNTLLIVFVLPNMFLQLLRAFVTFFQSILLFYNRIILACIAYLLGGLLPLKLNDPCRFPSVITPMLLIRMFLK